LKQHRERKHPGVFSPGVFSFALIVQAPSVPSRASKNGVVGGADEMLFDRGTPAIVTASNIAAIM
jgi:hypothetical protein